MNNKPSDAEGLKGKVTGVRFEAILEINSDVAEVLAHSMSYELATHVVDKCTSRYPKERVKEAFRLLAQACQNIVRTRDDAVKAMNEALGGKR